MDFVRVTPEYLISESPRVHAALGCSYAVSDPPAGVYGDDACRKLTDGVEPTKGFGEGKSVGWTAPLVTVTFDLGKPRRVDRVEVSCQGGSYAAVNWPTESVLMLSQSKPPAALAHPGPMPDNLRSISGSEPEVVRRRSATDMDGVVTFTVASPLPTRYAALTFRTQGWLMLSEVRVFEDGVNISRDPTVTYTLRPLPTPTPEAAARYVDDGVRLTDGIIASTLNRALVTGWLEPEKRTVLVNLDGTKPVSSVTVWSLAGGLHGVYAPARVEAAGYDGREWHELGTAKAAHADEDGRVCRALAYRLDGVPSVKLRALRITVTRSRGWTMLSEVEVQ